MADLGYIKSLLRQVPDDATRKALDQAFTHVLGNLRFGGAEHHTRAVNHQAYFQTSTTAAASTSEFSILHGLPSPPKIAIPVLDLSQPGAKVVPLEVARVADGARVYLKSTSTSAAVWLLVE